MEAFARILRWNAELQRSLARRARGEALWTSVLFLALGTTLAVGVASTLGPGQGRWAWMIFGLGLLGAGNAWWSRWWLDPARKDPVEAARFAERHATEMETGLVTALQAYALLQSQGPAGWPLPSRALAEASAERTLERLEGVEAISLIDHGRHDRLRSLALAASIILAGLAGAAPPWWDAGLRGLTASPAEVENASPIELALSDIGLRLQFPEYLGLESRTLEGTRGDVSAIAGTTIEVRGKPTLPGTRAELLIDLETTQRIPMASGGDGFVQGSFLARESGRYRIALVHPDGERFEEKKGRVLDVRPDGAPMIRLLRPEADLEVREGDPITMAFEASDDHGVDQVALWVDGPIGGPERRVLRRDIKDTVVKGVDEVGVGSLGLSPGESAEIWLEAADANDVTGPGVGVSSRRRIWMYSPEQEHARRLTDLEALIDVQIDLLADRLESPVHGEDLDRATESVMWHQTIVSSAAAVIASMESLVGALNTDTLASETLRELLTESLASLRSTHEQEGALLRRAALSQSQLRRPKVLLRMLAQTNDEATSELEKHIFRLKDELDRSRQDRVLEEGRELLEQQESLRELMARLADGDQDPELLAEAERQIDQLEASLQRMANELDRLAEQSPYENQNPSQRPSETQEEVSSMEAEMEEIRELLRQGKVEEAMKRLDALNKATQEWMAALDEDFGERDTTPSPHRRALTEFQMELSEITDGQRGVESETGAESDALHEKRLEALKAELSKAYEEALELARRLAARLESTPESALHPADQKELGEARGQSVSVVSLIKKRAIQEALDTARPLGKSVEALHREVAESEAREADEARSIALAAVLDGLRESEAMAHELERLLEELLKELERPPGAKAKRRMSSIGKRQRALRRAVGRLEGKLGGLEEAIPGLSDELGPPLEQARKEMRDAREALERGEPGQAQRHQRAALDRLSDAQSRFEGRARNNPNGRGGGQGIHGARDEVAIPDADPYQAPEDFRRELIEAMKERAPAGYEDAVRRYYEELTR